MDLFSMQSRALIVVATTNRSRLNFSKRWLWSMELPDPRILGHEAMAHGVRPKKKASGLLTWPSYPCKGASVPLLPLRWTTWLQRHGLRGVLLRQTPLPSSPHRSAMGGGVNFFVDSADADGRMLLRAFLYTSWAKERWNESPPCTPPCKMLLWMRHLCVVQFILVKAFCEDWQQALQRLAANLQGCCEADTFPSPYHSTSHCRCLSLGAEWPSPSLQGSHDHGGGEHHWPLQTQVGWPKMPETRWT